jgi:hypothetical protein
MSEMVKRVASATDAELQRQEGRAEISPLGPELTTAWLDQGEVDFAAVARAAIEAMREPTSAMSSAAQFVAKPDTLWSFEAVWRAMIDAALKP